MMETGSMIKSMDYATVVTDKKMKGSGLVRGDILLLISHKDVQISKKDAYLTRRYFLGAKVVGDEHQIPNDSNGYMSYLVDPRNLEKVGDEQREKLNAALALQYS